MAASGPAARHSETVADVRFYVEIGFAPVRCRHCGVEAAVKKNSRRHTSVQWSAASVAGCPEISAVRAANPDALVLGCPQLAASIDDAVQAGDLVVLDG